MEHPLDKKLQGFQLIAQEKLQAIICSIPGKKDLIIEHGVLRPLERVCNASWLRLKGIQRIYKFEDASNVLMQRGNIDQVKVIMIRSNLKTFKRVLTYIRASQAAVAATETDVSIKNFHIICVPSCFRYFQDLLEIEGLYGFVQLYRYNWDFICLDQGVLSLELPSVFSNIYVQADTSLLPAIAQSFRILQMITGQPELLITYGEQSANIVKMLEALGPWQKNQYDQSLNAQADFSTIMIIDRDRDYASSLLTPAIYSGLLLEVFNHNVDEIDINANTNKILKQKLPIFLTHNETHNNSNNNNNNNKKTETSANALKKPDKSTTNLNKFMSTIRLCGLNDEIYGENCYKHFTHASSLIRSEAKAIGLEVQKLSNMKLDEMHDYVARKLPKITELKAKLTRHLNASEKVIKMLAGNFQKVQSLEADILNNVSRKRILTEIEEMLATEGQRYNILRLFCLLHLCAGIATDEMSIFIRNYCNFFGVQYLQIFLNLAKAELLPTLHEDEKINKTITTTKLLSNLALSKFPNQTEFQANANRLKLLVSSTPTDKNGVNSITTNDAGGGSAASSGSGSGASSGGGGASANGALNMNGAACPSYVFNGIYIPLVAQLCHFILKTTNAEDLANKLTMIDKIQIQLRNAATNTYTMPVNAKVLAHNVKQQEIKDPFPLRKKNIFVYILGGVTYAEIGACNLISRLTGTIIIMASDCILSGADLIASAQ